VTPDAPVLNSDPGSRVYQTLEFGWHDEGVEMRINLYFAANANSWWVSQVRTYNGQTPGDWIYYPGPLFTTPLGAAFSGNVDLFGAGLGGVGRLQMNNLRLAAFQPGTMPPDFDQCLALGRDLPAVQSMDTATQRLDPYGITTGMTANEVGERLDAANICHVFRLEFPRLNQAQIWCEPPPGKVREYLFGTSGELLVFVDDRTRGRDEPVVDQVVGC
jgi:hypothetical protein